MELNILQDYYVWRERLAIIRDLYIQVEILSILEDNNRKCSMFILPPHILERYMEDVIIPNGLGVELIGKMGSSGEEGFTHNLKMLSGKNTQIHGVVYKERQDGLDFIEAYRKDDNKRMGELLGYPKCCTELYQHIHNKRPNIIDLVVPQNLLSEEVTDNIEVHVEGNPYANAMLRYIGVRFSPHMPCSPTCEASIKLAKSVESAMRKVDNDSANHVLELLSMPITYKTSNGNSIISSPVVRVMIPNYDWGKEVVIHYKPMNRP